MPADSQRYGKSADGLVSISVLLGADQSLLRRGLGVVVEAGNDLTETREVSGASVPWAEAANLSQHLAVRCAARAWWQPGRWRR
jgi:hypothetical protein